MTDHASSLGALTSDSPPVLPSGATPGDTGAASPVDGSATAGGTATQPPEPVYTVVEDWVIDYFLPMFRRTLGGELRWCGQWWQHGEAISRLTCLWHAWEVLRLQPGTGMATWYRDHLDHQLPILMGARGPFYQCSETAHREPREAVAMPSPGTWWDGTDGAVPGDSGPTMPMDVVGAGEDGD
jgi:Domain of unknown function (DUF4913)